MEDIIRFNHFSFKYYSQAEPTLYDIQLNIQKGEKIHEESINRYWLV